MHPVLQFGIENEINEALAFDARFAGEGRRDDTHIEVGFAVTVAGMAHMSGMAGGIVLHIYMSRMQGGCEFIANQIGTFHGHKGAFGDRTVKRRRGSAHSCRSGRIGPYFRS